MRVLIPVTISPESERLQPGDAADVRGLAGAVRPHHADAVARLHEQRQVAKQGLVALRLAGAAQLQDRLAQPPARRQTQRHRPGALLVRLGVHRRVEAIDARLLLGGARLRPTANPVQLAPHERRALLLAHLFVRQPLGLLLQKSGVAAHVRAQLAAIQLQDARHHAVEKIAIVRHQQQRALVPAQPLLHPLDGGGVQVVGRLVERQQLRPADERARQRHAPPLTARERADHAVAPRQLQRRRQPPHLRLQLARLVIVIGGTQPRAHRLGHRQARRPAAAPAAHIQSSGRACA